MLTQLYIVPKWRRPFTGRSVYCTVSQIVSQIVSVSPSASPVRGVIPRDILLVLDRSAVQLGVYPICGGGYMHASCCTLYVEEDTCMPLAVEEDTCMPLAVPYMFT